MLRTKKFLADSLKALPLKPVNKLLCRRGFVFYIVIAAAALMAIFAGSYYSFSRHVGFSAFHGVNREKLRVITDTILDSAFCDFQIETHNPESPLFKRTVEVMRGSMLNSSPFTLTASLFEKNKNELLQGSGIEYELTGSFFDRRVISFDNAAYYNGEGLATLEISLKAKLKQGKRVLASCFRRRHYDVKSVCLVSNKNNRKNSYAMSFALDYALLLRGKSGPKKNVPIGAAMLEANAEGQPNIKKRGLIYSESGTSHLISVKNAALYGSEKNPKFFNRFSRELKSLGASGQNGFRPFAHYGLYAMRCETLQELIDSGVYDKSSGILNLHGIISVENEAIELSQPPNSKSLIIRGKGVLAAPKGFVINCGIKRENASEDLCVLFTREGNIEINTSEPIESSLLAFNDSSTGSISINEACVIKGALGADRLNLANYLSKASIAEYDSRLCAEQNSEEIFCVSASPWIRMEDISFGRQ